MLLRYSVLMARQVPTLTRMRSVSLLGLLLLASGCGGRAASVAETGGMSAGGNAPDGDSGGSSASAGTAGDAGAGATAGGAAGDAGTGSSTGATGAAGQGPGPCNIPCASPLAGIHLAIISSAGPGEVPGAQAVMSGPVTVSLSCSGFAMTTRCFPNGGGPAGNYSLQVTAPGFGSVTEDATVTFTPPQGCGCASANLQPSVVTLNPLR